MQISYQGFGTATGTSGSFSRRHRGQSIHMETQLVRRVARFLRKLLQFRGDWIGCLHSFVSPLRVTFLEAKPFLFRANHESPHEDIAITCCSLLLDLPATKGGVFTLLLPSVGLPIEARGFRARFSPRNFDRRNLALILFQSFLCIGSADRVRSSSTSRAEVFSSCRIPSDNEMLHLASVLASLPRSTS
jgi:hypothetical protein